jgi:hypothetical protein
VGQPPKAARLGMGYISAGQFYLRILFRKPLQVIVKE